jgi:hypothetical protein
VNFHNLKSIVATQKSAIDMRTSTESFCVAPKRDQPYIEPTFSKIEFSTEKPAVILISAVGATGKTTLAQVLSGDLGLPLLDLGKHKPVGDNTLTGLLTTAFSVADLSSVFAGISKGSYGLIIDGVDEGRSKTTEKAFEAFLDDVVRLCAGSTNPSFVLLGRTQILDDCWLYLTDKGIATGLLSISPFDLKSAQTYIDKFTGGSQSAQAHQYSEVRDSILKMLMSAFTDGGGSSPDSKFLSFIGYPPVLDAIVTLLRQEPNYYRIQQEIEKPGSGDVEFELLHRIATYILTREKEQKVLPNVIRPLVDEMPSAAKEEICAAVFDAGEQCLRLLSHCLGKTAHLSKITEPLINEKYEEHLLTFIPEHPFIAGRQFRNAIFEAFALASVVSAFSEQGVKLALEYWGSHRYNYHFVYLLQRIARERSVPIACLQALLGSALEFKSQTTAVQLFVGVVEGEGAAGPADETVQTEIEIIMGTEQENLKKFSFESLLHPGASVHLGHQLANAIISLPCDLSMSGIQEIELTAPVEISASRINLAAPGLVLKQEPNLRREDKHVVLEADNVESAVNTVLTNGVELRVVLPEGSSLTFPLVKYVRREQKLPQDPALREKYLRLRRILVQFRSHSRGSLAKYRVKIDNERVAGNQVGQAILQRLLADGILTLDGRFYFLQPDSVDTHLGISWLDLRTGSTSEKLLAYLSSIET